MDLRSHADLGEPLTMNLVNVEVPNRDPAVFNLRDVLAYAFEIFPELNPSEQAILAGVYQRTTHGRGATLVEVTAYEASQLRKLQFVGLLYITDEGLPAGKLCTCLTEQVLRNRMISEVCKSMGTVEEAKANNSAGLQQPHLC